MFDNSINKFEIQHRDTTLKVERLNLPGNTIFRIVFSSERQPLVVARAIHANQGRFWTSIPEGRQKEAEGCGKLIEEYFKQHQSSA